MLLITIILSFFIINTINKKYFYQGLGLVVGFIMVILLRYQFAAAYPFNPQTPTILGGDMHLVESADFNADGKNDLVVTDGKTMRGIGILYGNGNGTFQAPLILGDGDTYEWGLAIADVDGVNGPDIVVGNSNLRQLQIYKNTGTGVRFTGAFDVVPLNNPDGTRQADLTVADINNDTKLDIIVATENTMIFDVFTNDGNGNFTYTTSGGNGSGHGGKGMVAFDYTGDGWKDVIIADENANEIQVYQNDGAGNFGSMDYSFSATTPYSVSIVDFNGDSVYELVVTSPADGISIVSLDGSTVYKSYPGSAYYSKVVDFNADGNLDVLWSDASVTGVQVTLGNGDLTFNAPVAYSVNFNPLGIAVNDFDGDNLPDAAAVNHGNTLSIFLTATLPQTAGVWVSPTPNLANTNETGPVATTFQIGLSSEPTDIIEIAFTNTDGQLQLTKDGNPVSGVCFVPASMSTTPGISPFEPCNTWNLGQEITVTPVVDGTPEGTHAGVVEFTAITSPDTNYSSLLLPANLTTIIADAGDTTAPVINSVTILGPSGTSPNFEATSGSDSVTLSFISDEILDLTTSVITIGGVTATCTAPSIITDPYICTIPAASLVIGTVYGQALTNIEITPHDAAGNIGTTENQTGDGTSVLIVASTPSDTTAPVITLTTSSTSVSAPFTVTITPSESITGLTLSDITVINGTASNLLGPDGSGNYTVVITPTTGTVTVQIPTGSVTDGASNSNTTASNTLTINYSLPIITPGSGGGVLSTLGWNTVNSSAPNANTTELIKDKKSCPHFTQYMRYGDRDGKRGISEVKKMQEFLNTHLGTKLPVSGTFGLQTKKAVEQYQKKYADKVLTPWNLSKPTGRWYQSTRNLANSHVGCNEGEVFLDNGNKVNN